MTIYLFDTYAILEMIKGNPSYDSFTEVNFRTTIFNLYELYYSLLKIPKKLVVIKDGLHNLNRKSDRRIIYNETSKWFKKYLS